MQAGCWPHQRQSLAGSPSLSRAHELGLRHEVRPDCFGAAYMDVHALEALAVQEEAPRNRAIDL